MIYFPMSNVRSVDEILLLIEALQTSDEHSVETPEAWQPGEKVIVSPPASSQEAQARADSSEYECNDWYFCKKAVSIKQEATETWFPLLSDHPTH
jgi:peroxiredoxin (alkyl hydroperoxide reductase subunit C)